MGTGANTLAQCTFDHIQSSCNSHIPRAAVPHGCYDAEVRGHHLPYTRSSKAIQFRDFNNSQEGIVNDST